MLHLSSEGLWRRRRYPVDFSPCADIFLPQNRLSKHKMLCWRSRYPSTSLIESIATNMKAIVRYGTSFSSSITRASSVNSSLAYLLHLPREIRDLIYDIIVSDEHQRTQQNYTCLYNLPLRHSCHGLGKQYTFVMVSMIRSEPASYTSSAFQICKQIRFEILDALRRMYQSKTLIVTVTSIDEWSDCPSQNWRPDISYFSRVRFDIILSDETVGAISKCLCFVAMLLVNRRDLSLHVLEIRVGYSYVNASAAVLDHGLALVVEAKEVVQSMRQLVPYLKPFARKASRAQNSKHSWVNVRWGVSRAQIEAGEFDCHCSYLSATFLEQMWQRACNAPETEDTNVRVKMSEEDCRDFGCAHHCR